MDDMFYWCFHLTSVGDLSGWDTSRVKDMSSMFDECYDLTSLDLSGWVPSQVTEMDSMFYHCIALTNLDLSGWDTSQVTNMLSMFDGCEALISLDLSGWDTSRVPDMSYMFRDCNALTSLEGLSSWDTRQVTDMYFMFDDCSQLTATISILNNSVTSYGGMFRNAATKNNAQITVNYSSESEALVEQMIATKNNANSNVIKADSPYVAHSVTIQGRNDIIATPSGGIMFTQITLTPTQENYMVTSFDMNGRKIEGNTFAMPNEEVVITNVTISEGVLWESSHNPYNNNLDETYEHTFEGAGSLTVTLEYQTESASWDYIYLYDSTQKQYGEYGGKTKTTETIIIPGDYIKILFHTDESGNDYYGFKATVIPNYE